MWVLPKPSGYGRMPRSSAQAQKKLLKRKSSYCHPKCLQDPVLVQVECLLPHFVTYQRCRQIWTSATHHLLLKNHPSRGRPFRKLRISSISRDQRKAACIVWIVSIRRDKMTHGKWSGYVVRNHTKQNQIHYRGRSALLPGDGWDRAESHQSDAAQRWRCHWVQGPPWSGPRKSINTLC